MTTRFPLLCSLPLLVCGSAAAQSFNVDLGTNTTYPLPAPTYGAAASQPGPWVNGGTTSPVAALTDINGVVTAAALTFSVTGTGINANTYGLTGDDQMLLCDLIDMAGNCTFTFTNLQAGDYALYTYAWASDNNMAITLVTPGPGAAEGPQPVGGTWTGAHVQGITYALHHFANVPANGSIAITTSVQTTFDSINGFQLVHGSGGPPANAYCFGDGTGTACPCGNNGAVGNGCASSVNPAGGNLAATGAASIANDTFSLNGSGMPNSSALYFQGTTQTAGGAGTAFGDGLRCASGSIIRLGTKTNVGGSSSYPGGSTPVSVKGNNAAGNVRTYQCWYRNAAAFCNQDTFNLTNGITTTWAP
jgi:hypothetical protein